MTAGSNKTTNRYCVTSNCILLESGTDSYNIEVIETEVNVDETNNMENILRYQRTSHTLTLGEVDDGENSTNYFSLGRS
jgi:hypothetical protein